MKTFDNILGFVKSDFYLIIICFIVYLLCGIGVITSAIFIGIAVILSVIVADIFSLLDE